MYKHMNIHVREPHSQASKYLKEALTLVKQLQAQGVEVSSNIRFVCVCVCRLHIYIYILSISVSIYLYV